MNETIILANNPWAIFILLLIFPGSALFAAIYCLVNGDKIFGAPEKKELSS